MKVQEVCEWLRRGALYAEEIAEIEMSSFNYTKELVDDYLSDAQRMREVANFISKIPPLHGSEPNV